MRKKPRGRKRQLRNVLKDVSKKNRAPERAVSAASEPPYVVGFDESKLVELAVDIWKLEKNVKKAISLDENRPIRSSLGKLAGYIESYGLSIRDYTGQRYHENLNVKVLSFEPADGVEPSTVIDTVKPAVFADGKLLSHGLVIVSQAAES